MAHSVCLSKGAYFRCDFADKTVINDENKNLHFFSNFLLQDHQKFLKQYEDFFVEWWSYYYDMIGTPLPADRDSFRLLQEHDPGGSFDAFKEGLWKCPENPK